MATIIFWVFFLIFTNIIADNPKCEKKSYCECSKYNPSDPNIVNVYKKNVTFTIKVKSWSYLQIECKNISRNDFNLTKGNFGKIVDSVEFKNCPIPKNSTFKGIVENLGINETNGLSFQSYKDISKKLRLKHFRGFSNVTKLVLSYNGLTYMSSSLFKKLSKLEFLDLSENFLVLSKESFNNASHLKYLDLNGNGITELDTDTFDNIQNLESLNFERNLLLKVNNGSFDKLSSLQNLNLKSNLLSSLPETIFHKLENLETIDLSNNNFSSVPLRLFNQNKKLKKILLHHNRVNLTTLPDQFFTDLLNLEEVQLRKNGLKYIPENLFWGSTSLKYIDLSENFLQELTEFVFLDVFNTEYLFLSHNMFKTFPDIVFKNLQKLKLLDLSFNRIGYFQSTLLEGLKTLTELNMEGNGLIYIEKAAFLTNQKLTIAKFSNNQLQFSYLNKMTSPFFNNRLLKELHLANNHIKHFLSEWTINKAKLELLDLSFNDINQISANNFVFPSDKVKVDLKYNNISNIWLNDIDKLSMHHIKKRKVVIRLTHNPILCDCNLYHLLRYANKDMPITVYNFVKLRLENLRCVHPDGIQGPQINQLNFKTYQCLEDEYFGIEKNCQDKCTCNIRPYDATRVIDCSYKNISAFHIDKNKINIMGKYPLILNLTGNHLKKIRSLKGFESINVTELLLSNNKISELSLNTVPTTVKVLELHNNNITRLDYNLSDFLFHQDFKVFTLSGNPFICDCDAEFLYRLVLEKQHSYTDLKNVKCKDNNIPLLNMTHEQLCPSMVLH